MEKTTKMNLCWSILFPPNLTCFGKNITTFSFLFFFSFHLPFLQSKGHLTIATVRGLELQKPINVMDRLFSYRVLFLRPLGRGPFQFFLPPFLFFPISSLFSNLSGILLLSSDGSLNTQLYIVVLSFGLIWILFWYQAS